MKANDYQIGGDHYKKYQYEHWDWATDTDQPFLIATATKYIARWRDKAGIQDLRKAAHYITKAKERGVKSPMADAVSSAYNISFCVQLHTKDRVVISAIINNNFDSAQKLISDLMREAEFEVINKSHGDIDQSSYTRG